jgi:hypothetical protein
MIKLSTLLTIKKHAQEIKDLYDSDPRNLTFNAIIHGPLKMGKTSLLRTCPKPIFIHSFDPNGTLVLQDMIDSGEVLVDTRFEKEDPFKPKACRLWEDEFNYLYRKDFFSHVGTFALDSMTTWAQIVMYEVIRRAAEKKKDREVGGAPQENDWLPQMAFIENYMRKFLSLPCHCILLGHSEQQKDREGNTVGDLGIMITGKLRERVPALFSEIYYLRMKDYKTETRELLIRPTYGIQVGSRLGHGGKLDKTEPPDIKKIMLKVGIDPSDKPLFKDLEETETTTNNKED